MRTLAAVIAPPKGKRRTATLAFAALVGLAVIGWAAARQIKSPAQVAADTAAPKAAPITVPVVLRTLSTEVIVRGTVRYGAPQAVVLGTSVVKAGSSDIVTRPPQPRARLQAGHVAMTVDGRPVFVLPGAIPMHRDLRPGDHGPDVRQLERGLNRLGFRPGRVDGRYDSATAGAVSSFYLHRGWDPFGATDAQVDALRTAEAAAAASRDARLQAINTLEQARRGAPADAAQARVDAVTARDGLNTARLAVSTATQKLGSARGAASAAKGAADRAQADNRKDLLVAKADVSTKRAAFKAAVDNQELARFKFAELERGAASSDQVAASNAIREATDDVARTKADLEAAVATQKALQTGQPAAVRRARNEAAQANRDVRDARAELRRARLGVLTAREQARLAARRADVMSRNLSTRTLERIAAAAGREARRTAAIVSRLSRRAGVQVPANELLFFRALPLRVDSVRAKRGSAVTGPVMRVTNSRLAVDSSLAVSDAKLVHTGDKVTIEEQELGIKAPGAVAVVSDTPGTNKVDPTRFYFNVLPAAGFPSIVGTSVKLTIAVKSTKGRVLAVPPSALSVSGDGNSRLQVRGRDGRTRVITVVPGLAAEGLVEVRPAPGQQLRPGDLIIVGSRTGRGP